jgi:hypothetical protein
MFRGKLIGLRQVGICAERLVQQQLSVDVGGAAGGVLEGHFR